MKLMAQLILLMATMVASLNAARAADSCEECQEFKFIAQLLRGQKPNSPAATPGILKAQNVLERLPRGNGNTLTLKQVEAITDVLAAARGNDPDASIIESDIRLFKANEKAFFAAFQKLSDRSMVQYLNYSLNLKLGELEHGSRK